MLFWMSSSPHIQWYKVGSPAASWPNLYLISNANQHLAIPTYFLQKHHHRNLKHKTLTHLESLHFTSHFTMGFTTFSGPSSSFPPMSQWKSFEEIFNTNKTAMFATGDTGPDIGAIWNAVLECAKLGVEERVIFCIIMQESTGNVGVQTTFNGDGHATAGLMQCDGSPGFPGRHGLTQAQITSMVRAGTEHFKANLKEFGDADTADTIYKALRAYNSGSVNVNNLSDGRGATDSYVSDVANRLLGRTN